MRYGLKERLVGAFAVIMAAVLLLPFLLEPERIRLDDASSSTPLASSMWPLNPEPDRVNEDTLSPPLVEMDAPRDLPPARSMPILSPARTNTDLYLAETGQAEAWAIQVASLSEAANAQRLLQSLAEQGYRPYWRSIGAILVVFVGPYLDQEEARRQQDRLLRERQLSTRLTRYVPEHEARQQGTYLKNRSE